MLTFAQAYLDFMTDWAPNMTSISLHGNQEGVEAICEAYLLQYGRR